MVISPFLPFINLTRSLQYKLDMLLSVYQSNYKLLKENKPTNILACEYVSTDTLLSDFDDDSIECVVICKLHDKQIAFINSKTVDGYIELHDKMRSNEYENIKSVRIFNNSIMSYKPSIIPFIKYTKTKA